MTSPPPLSDRVGAFSCEMVVVRDSQSLDVGQMCVHILRDVLGSIMAPSAPIAAERSFPPFPGGLPRDVGGLTRPEAGPPQLRMLLTRVISGEVGMLVSNETAILT